MESGKSIGLKLEELEEATDFLSRKWRPLIVYTLSERGSMGFNDLKSSLEGVSGKVLSENLDDLQQKGYVEKDVLSDSPKRVEYSLTERGKDLKPVMEKMLEWAERARRQETVLVVEDEPQLRELYSEWLSGDFKCRTAATAEEAMDEMDVDVDVVMLDRMLPDLDGTEVAENIRSSFDPQIVFLTAKEPDTEIADVEIDDYLVKPVSAEDIISKTDEVVERTDKEELKQELLALTSRKQAIEEHANDDPETSEKYRKLLKRIQEIKQNQED